MAAPGLIFIDVYKKILLILKEINCNIDNILIPFRYGSYHRALIGNQNMLLKTFWGNFSLYKCLVIIFWIIYRKFFVLNHLKKEVI